MPGALRECREKQLVTGSGQGVRSRTDRWSLPGMEVEEQVRSVDLTMVAKASL
ncbi:MAG TPA: hypothetical protein VG273_23435 [Bryobacteraceae bacterium]|nr:hypothetical protein [Bryobacteraceae bacterium]